MRGKSRPILLVTGFGPFPGVPFNVSAKLAEYLALDAAHLAAAEIGGAEVVLTCDDIMVRRARRLDLSLRVLNPVAYLREVAGNG